MSYRRVTFSCLRRWFAGHVGLLKGPPLEVLLVATADDSPARALGARRLRLVALEALGLAGDAAWELWLEACCAGQRSSAARTIAALGLLPLGGRAGLRCLARRPEHERGQRQGGCFRHVQRRWCWVQWERPARSRRCSHSAAGQGSRAEQRTRTAGGGTQRDALSKASPGGVEAGDAA